LTVGIHALLRERSDEILRAWDALVAADRAPPNVGGSVLRRLLPEVVEGLAAWLSDGEPPPAERLRAAVLAAAAGLEHPFELAHLVHELGLLRTAILRVLFEPAPGGAGVPLTAAETAPDLARLNAGLDVAISDAVEHFVAAREQRIATLDAAERRYTELVQLSPEAILVNRRGRIEFANPAAVELFGAATERDLMGKTAFELFHPENHDAIRARIRRLLSGEARFNSLVEMRIVRLDGGERHVEAAAAVCDDRNGRAIQVVLRDITDRKRAEEAQRLGEATLRGFLDASGALLALVELDGDDFAFVLPNAEVARFFGRPVEAVTGRRAGELGLPAPLIAEGIEVFGRCLASGRAIAGEYELPRGGASGWYHATVSPVPAGPSGRPRFAVVAIDITDRRRAEEAARDADRRKTEFLAILSHELRNPLAPIRNSVELLERVPPEGPLALRARQIIRRQADQLTSLVDDLLDMSRIDHGKITLERVRVDARDVVSRACEDLLPTFEERAVLLRRAFAAEPLHVDVDPTRLAQIVTNLLTNAAKFTPRSGVVDVTLARAGGAAGDRCELRVRDTGVGIEAHLLERIFEPFTQVERTRGTARGGMGIGLALVKSLVAMQGGTVRAASEGLGRGAEFVVSLPLAAARAEEPRPAAAHAHHALDVLIVEDNPDAGATLADLLELQGHRTRVALDGASGIAAFAASPPDVLICDVGLPDLDGHEVVRRVRRLEGGGAVFAIALTGYAQPDDVRRALEAGFDAHLAKPPVLEKLDELLAQVRG
jgi:PAS domain S-box-containing protein